MSSWTDFRFASGRRRTESGRRQSQLNIAQGLNSESRRTLEVLVGRYPAAELEVAEGFAPLPPTVAPGLPSSLLERRPDIVAAEHQVLAAFRTEQAAKLLLPSFSLNLEGGRLSDPLLSVLGLNPWLVHAAAGMFVPIYEGGALRAQIKIATAQQEQSIAHFGGIALRAFAEVEVALTNEQLLDESLPATTRGVGRPRDTRLGGGGVHPCNAAGPVRVCRPAPRPRHREGLRPFSHPTATASPPDPGQSRPACADSRPESVGKPRWARVPVASEVSFP